ncbi:MAG TPA: LuxR C-terminal-related transcriptional regulator [Kofleriaceae bacterium]|nr:LuxR C-terminal-related transcriptional regulator [Kofleriaceae bacterium]
MARPAESSGEGVLLIVEDGPTGLLLVRALEALSIEVSWTRTAAELIDGLAGAAIRAPEVVFLDLELADADVEGLVPLLRRSFPHAAVVALAGALGGEGAARLLCQGVPSLSKPVSPLALAGLAMRLSLDARNAEARRAGSNGAADGSRRGEHLESVFSSYSVDRVLSKQQQTILRQYLNGMSDKEIARLCRCSEATVYEHWRRMARKAGGSHKGDVIADFHRFLAGE